MAHTLDVLRNEHRNIGFFLDLLARQADLLENSGQPDLKLITEITDYFRSFPDMYHHPKEDLVLGRLRERVAALEPAIAELESEHDELSDELHSFSRTVVALLTDPCPSTRAEFLHSARAFIERERQHMAVEERFLFPAAEQSLTEEDWSEIDEVVDRFSDPMSAPDAGHRFFILRDRLSNWQRGDAA